MTDLSRSPGPRALVFLVISGVLVFGTLAVLVALRWAPLIDLDTRATTAAYRDAFSTGWLRAGARAATAVGSPITVDVITAVAALGSALARQWLPALAIAVGRLAELGIESAVKVVLDRPRPAFTPPLTAASGASFPSGHAAGSSAVYVVLLLLALPWLARRWSRLVVTAVVLLLVLAIAASRLLLGVHYPSDVLGGLGLGWACAAAAVLLIRAGPLRRMTGRVAA
ncbi:MAG TPA: phosphatase PAP2 family protein [Pseudonocardiaceae bacterium]|nr:phosphatase PAP2 family protein [Pseudonocardiaceae bacterium]